MTPTFDGRAALQTTSSPEVWAFGISNAVVFLLTMTLAVIAFRAYQREDLTPFLVASGGFVVLAFGFVVEAVYEFCANEGYQAFGRELYLLRTVEATLLAVGVGLLLLSLRRI